MFRQRSNNYRQPVLLFLAFRLFCCVTASPEVSAQTLASTATVSTNSLVSPVLLGLNVPLLHVGLNEVLQRTGAENLLIKESEARLNVARATENRINAWYLPTFSAGIGTYGASGTVMNARGEFFQNVQPNNTSLMGGVMGEWRIADAVYATKAAELRSLAAMDDVAAQRLRSVALAIATYFDIAAAQERIRLLGETYKLNERLYTQLSLQQGAGLTYKSDVLLVQSSLSRLKLLTQQAAAESYRRSAELSAILNLDRLHLVIADEAALVPVRLNDTLAVDSLIQSALKTRPELRSINNEMDAIRHEADALTLGRLLPTITLNLSTMLFGAVPLPQYGRAASTLGVSWSAPLADMLGRGQAQQTEAALNLRTAQLHVVENQIEREIASFTGALAMLRPALAFARDELSAAQEALRQSVERQKLGTAKPLEVLQAYDAVTRAQGDYVQVVSEYNKAEYGLFLARGNIISEK
jgi:outer membrane protein TolC